VVSAVGVAQFLCGTGERHIAQVSRASDIEVGAIKLSNMRSDRTHDGCVCDQLNWFDMKCSQLFWDESLHVGSTNEALHRKEWAHTSLIIDNVIVNPKERDPTFL
jgi:hypothetical protein